MNSYDSDSDLEDAEQGTSTDVLLGYTSEEATDDAFNQLGGEPSWLDSSQRPSPMLFRCNICNDYSALLLQLNANLPERFAGHERRLYIWACRRKACRRKPGSIRATRAVEVLSSKNKAAPPRASGPAPVSQAEAQPRRDLGVSLFGGDGSGTPLSPDSPSNPFSTSSITNPFAQSSSSNPFASSAIPNPFSTTATATSTRENLPHQDAVESLSTSFAAKASMNTTIPPPTAPRPAQATLPWPTQNQLPKPHKSYHLEADYEFLSEISTSQSLNANYAALMDVDAPSTNGGGRGGSEKEDGQLYESEHDRTFQHFADVSSQNPEQVLRYEFNGSPLLYSRSDAVGHVFSAAKPETGSMDAKINIAGPLATPQIPKCEHCGAPRVFEMQLMPHAIAELESDQDLATLLEEGMEWGTIILAVCSRDCGSGDGKVEYLEEWVGVQWEETKK